MIDVDILEVDGSKAISLNVGTTRSGNIYKRRVSLNKIELCIGLVIFVAK